MGLDAWKALPFPGRTTAHVATVCLGGSPEAGGSEQVRQAQSNIVVCRYVERYGAVSLPATLPLSAQYSAIDPTYYFIGGKLAEIQISASIDAFNSIVATLDVEYGASSETTRDQVETGLGVPLPRVRRVWKLGRGEIRLTDPSATANRLVVVFLAPGADRTPLMTSGSMAHRADHANYN